MSGNTVPNSRPLNRGASLVKNTLIYFIGNFSSRILVFLLLPLYTNYLSPSDYGLVDIYVNLLAVFYSIFSFQAVEVVYRDLHDAETDEQKSNVVTNSLAICLFGIAIFSALVNVYSAIFGFEYAFLFSVYVAGSILSQYYLQAMRGLGLDALYAKAGVLSTFAQLTLNILLIVVLHQGAFSILVASTAAYLVAIVYLATKVRLWQWIDFDKIAYSTIKKQLKYSLPLMPNAICLWALNSIGRYILLFNYGSYEVGIFSYSSKFAQTLSVVNQIFFMSWQQVALSFGSAEDRDSFGSRVLTEYIRVQFSALLILLPAIKIAVFTIMGADYQNGWIYIPVFFIGMLFNAYANFYSMGFFIGRSTSALFVASALGMIVYVVGGVFLSSIEPIFGIAIAYALSQGVYFLITKLRVRDLFNPRITFKNIRFPTVFICLFGVFYYSLSWQLNTLVLLMGLTLFVMMNRKLLIKTLNSLLSKTLR